MSVTEAGFILCSMDRELKKFPEVESAFGKIGRARTATDPAPLSMVETVVVLKPESQWRAGLTWDTLIAEMDAALRYPGMPNVWWMPVQTRTEMLATGIRSALGVTVFGPKLTRIEHTAVEIEKALLEDPRTKPFTRIAWAGQFQYFQRAKAHLRVILPLTLFLVVVLLYGNTRSAACRTRSKVRRARGSWHRLLKGLEKDLTRSDGG